MKPAAFEYHAPTSVDEAITLLDEIPDAAVLAGGQSLIAMMNLRLAQPDHVVDVGRIEDLNFLEFEDARMRTGALLTQRRAETDPRIAERFPLLSTATRHIGFPAIRTRGTLGGSLAHADPAAELPLVAVTVGAELTLEARSGRRVVSADDFFVGHYTTARMPNELLVEVAWPIGWDTWGFSEFARRTGDFAIVSAAAVVNFDGDLVSETRVAVGGVASRPQRLTEVEESLRGGPLSESAITAAADVATDLVEPTGDIHANAAYRRRLVGVQVRRALARAAERMRHADA